VIVVSPRVEEHEVGVGSGFDAAFRGKEKAVGDVRSGE
jgi:hypothetical protein